MSKSLFKGFKINNKKTMIIYSSEYLEDIGRGDRGVLYSKRSEAIEKKHYC